jgi:hypothetical protein
MLTEAKLPVNAITIHGGAQVTREGRTSRVPKSDLVAVVQTLLQTERLGIDGNLPEAGVLTAELQAFKYAIGASGHTKFGNDVGLWREAPNDDLVLATACAAWFGESGYRPLRILSF